MNNLGYIISFEGIDFCGKTTQIKLLERYFRENKIEFITVSALSNTKISDMIKPVLLDIPKLEPLTELYLFSANRHQLVKEQIEPAIMDKKIVIIDRYIDSSTVYQGFFQNVNLELISNINKATVSGFEPDLTFLIDIKKESFTERMCKNDQLYNLDVIEQKISDCYEKISFAYNQLLKSNTRITLIDGEKSREDIHSDIIIKIKELLNI